MPVSVKIKNTLKSCFSAREDIVCVYLFGSQASGKQNVRSDVDIAVLFKSNLTREERTEKCLDLMNSLSSALDKDVDVAALNDASSFLRFQVIKNGQRIYERPGRSERGFEANAIVDYLDFLPIRRRLETAMLNNIKRA